MTLVNTNVIVFAPNPFSPDHDRARDAPDQVRREGNVGVTRQIMREFLAVITRPQRWALATPTATAAGLAASLTRSFQGFDDGPDVWAQLMLLAARFSFGGKQVHDANIVATMLAHGVPRLLSFSGADFRRFVPLIEVAEP